MKGMKATSYQMLRAAVEELKCPDCGGSGQVDDADLGDISFNTWTCTTCYGTGFKDGHSRALVRCAHDTR